MNGGLVIALPSKGRLKAKSEAVMAAMGFAIEQSDQRTYRGRVAGRDDIEVAFLSASEIARELAAGAVHLGITGADLVHEIAAAPGSAISLVAPLGFGRADVVVAVPELWIDVWTMADLDDVAAGFRARHGRRMRIATKYWNLTQRFFAAHGIALYRVVESLGATEGAPAAGAADAIVDITETGSTLAANHLKILDDGVILRSEAHLAASRAAEWSAAAEAAARDIQSRLGAAGLTVAAELPGSINLADASPG